MKTLRILLLLPVAAICSCSNTIDDYHYGYAPAYRTLPAGFEQATIGGTTYWHQGGRFYKLDGEKGYLLVDPPRGSEQVLAAANGTAPTPNGPNVEPRRTSWITPGGGKIKQEKRATYSGRSGIRRKRPVLNP